MADENLKHRVLAITGAASGIGRALALEAAMRGADVALTDVNAEELEATARKVEAYGRKASFHVVDVSDREAMQAFAVKAIDIHGHVDGIINNAGVTVVNDFESLSYEDMEWVMGINFWGVVHGTKAFLPHFKMRDEGWVVNISSVFGLIGFPTQSIYNATKFAVLGMSEALRHELSKTNISVSTVHPGGVKTQIMASSRFYRGFDGSLSLEKSAAEFARGAKTTPKRAAEIILDGMQKREPRILVGPDAQIIEKLSRLSPTGYLRLLKPLMDRLK